MHARTRDSFKTFVMIKQLHFVFGAPRTISLLSYATFRWIQPSSTKSASSRSSFSLSHRRPFWWPCCRARTFGSIQFVPSIFFFFFPWQQVEITLYHHGAMKATCRPCILFEFDDFRHAPRGNWPRTLPVLAEREPIGDAVLGPMT